MFKSLMKIGVSILLVVFALNMKSISGTNASLFDSEKSSDNSFTAGVWESETEGAPPIDSEMNAQTQIILPEVQLDIPIDTPKTEQIEDFEAPDPEASNPEISNPEVDMAPDTVENLESDVQSVPEDPVVVPLIDSEKVIVPSEAEIPEDKIEEEGV